MPKTLPATKHFKLAQTLRAQIRKMSPGDPLPTVLQLRERFSVSQATVDRALDRLRREGLITRPAGQLRPVVTDTPLPTLHRVALIRPAVPSAFYEQVAREVARIGMQKEWAFEWINYSSLTSARLREALGDHDAAVFMPSAEHFPVDLVSALKRPRRPVVMIQHAGTGLRVGSVRIDAVGLGGAAVRHLRSRGHARILFVPDEPASPMRRGIEEGWRQEMASAGETNVDELVVDCDPNAAETTLSCAYASLKKWFAGSHPEFTAAVCTSNAGASALLRALREEGISVPDQVSVVVCGDEGGLNSFAYPALTAMESSIAAIGRGVIELLEEQLADATRPTREITVPADLVERESTAQCAALQTS